MRRMIGVAAGVLGLALFGCADWDNPTALSELETETQFEVHASRVETFEEVEIHVVITESGSPMGMREAQLEIRHHDGELAGVVEMEQEGDGYAAHMTFFEPGEYHLQFHGMPEHHTIMAEMGEHEIEVHRRHQVIGPYWVELEVSPAPVFEDSEAHIHVLVFQLQGDGTPGDPVAGLEVKLEIHDPAEVETVLAVVEEEAGEYEAEFTFGEAGVYELHVEIDVDGAPEDGEFHIPVITELTDDIDDHDDGGDDHGHGHGN